MLPGWAALPVEQIPADADHHVAVPVAVLTGAMTFSAAEDFVAAFDAMHRGITVGEATGGSTGQPLIFHLPGGGSARVCTKDDRAANGMVFEGVGLVPRCSLRRRSPAFALEPILLRTALQQCWSARNRARYRLSGIRGEPVRC